MYARHPSTHGSSPPRKAAYLHILGAWSRSPEAFGETAFNRPSTPFDSWRTARAVFTIAKMPISESLLPLYRLSTQPNGVCVDWVQCYNAKML